MNVLVSRLNGGEKALHLLGSSNPNPNFCVTLIVSGEGEPYNR